VFEKNESKEKEAEVGPFKKQRFENEENIFKR